MTTEQVVFVEFWAKPKRPLMPFEVMTLETEPARDGRPERQCYLWYDCAPMKGGTLIFHCSGSGGFGPGTIVPEMHLSHGGPYWALAGTPIAPNNNRRLERLPERWRSWPPEWAVDAEIVECLECGFLPDDGSVWPDEDYRICPHLGWDTYNQEWVPVGNKQVFRVVVSKTDVATYEVEAYSEQVARETFWDLIDREGLDDRKTCHGPITITRVERVLNETLTA